MATKVNIQIDQGSLFDYNIMITDQNNNDFDFTGYTGIGEIKKHYDSNTAYPLTVTLSTGIINLKCSANTSNSMEPGRYQYDVYIDDSASDPVRIIEGIVTLTPRITNTND